ncbi:hypothetical protein D3C71_1623720 [compost metagenome]
MLLHFDQSKSINKPYQMLTVNYFSTSVQRLYKIGSDGNWTNYSNQPVKVNVGETIYAKGIDKYGNDTRVISSYTANVTDAITQEAYDGNDSTYITTISNTSLYMKIDPSMQGRQTRIKFYVGYAGVRIKFLDINKNVLSEFYTNVSYNRQYDSLYTIPTNTVWLQYQFEYWDRGSSATLYEIST